MVGRTSLPFPHAWLWKLHEEGGSLGSSEEGGSLSSSSPSLLLPQMEQASFHPGIIHEAGMAWLTKLSSVLTPTALHTNEEMQPALSSSMPNPLGPSAFLHPAVHLLQLTHGRRRMATQPIEIDNLCMEYDRGKVATTTGLSYDAEAGVTYLKVYLGTNASSSPVYEYGHRIVAWSVLGPPLPGQEVLHSCHNPKCLSPLHLKYGTHAENMGPVAERRREKSAKGARTRS